MPPLTRDHRLPAERKTRPNGRVAAYGHRGGWGYSVTIGPATHCDEMGNFPGIWGF